MLSLNLSNEKYGYVFKLGKFISGMKKSIFLIFLALVVVLMLQLVSAGPIDTVRDISLSTINAATSVFGPVFEAIFGGYDNEDFLFAKFLVLILLFVVINAVLRRIDLFRENRGIVVIVALIISVLAVRFMDENQLIRGILLPYGVLGVVMTTVIPFLVIFGFVHMTQMGSIGRRLILIFTTIVLLVIWAYKSGDAGSIINSIYGWTVLVMALVFIFDKKIHSYFFLHELGKFKSGSNRRIIANLQAEYLNILNVDSNTARARRREIEAQLRSLGAELS